MIEGKHVLGITHGDSNGIGYELLLRTLGDTGFSEMFVPVIYGSGRAMAYYRKVLGLPGFTLNVVRSAQQALPKRINLVECTERESHVEMGQPTREAGAAARAALERFFVDWQEGHVDGLVTMPVNKNTMQSADFSFPGHTEYLASKTGCDAPLMLMVSDRLRLGVATGHVPLAEVSSRLSQELIQQKLQVLYECLRRDFEIDAPRIAVLGLNPHAGEGGLLGTEELTIIEPAIEAANAEGKIVVGPFPADGFFGSGMWTKYDAVLAMYHDQGLTPFKTLSFEQGVNYTSGLPLVRTSPAHGTAYELVGKGAASCDSFRQAVYLALDVLRGRARSQRLEAAALPSPGRVAMQEGR